LTIQLCGTGKSASISTDFSNTDRVGGICIKAGRIKTDSYNIHNSRDDSAEVSPLAVGETPVHNLLTVKETAEYLRFSPSTVYYLVQRGKIPAIQIGGRWRIKKSSLDRDILRQDKQGRPTVLVVDDDVGLQDLFRTFLKQIGFGRVAVCTGKETLKSLRNHKFDLVFLDLQLPDAPGDQVQKTAKQIDSVPKVIVITGYPDSEILDRILQFSPVTVLKEPLTVEQLKQTVKFLTQKRPILNSP
jgi:excisionase family DNA binding protein